MSQPAVIVDHLWKRYHKRFGTSTLWSLFGRRERTDDEFWALKDVSFEVQPGECLGIIGPNGSGKSTLLKILSRITKATRGSVRVNGRVASMLEVGTGFHPELTGRENVFLSGAIMGMKQSDIRKRFDEIVAFSGVEEFIDVPVKRYSSGMYVRLAFAVAANIETDVLICDEVLSVGDAEFQKKCLGTMDDIGKCGRTVLFVSHNAQAVRSLCSGCVVLNRGAITFVGATEAALRHYAGSKVLAAERSWDAPNAPANSSARLLGIRVLGAGGVPQDTHSLSEGFAVEFRLCVTDANARNGLTLRLRTADGTVVFSSLIEAPVRGCGEHLIRCLMPPNLLNEGHYLITALMWRDSFQDAVTIEDVVEFTIVQKERPWGFLGNWDGVIRPKLTWTTAPVA